MLSRLFTHLKSLASRLSTELCGQLKQRTTPLTETMMGGAVNDVAKSKAELIAENALLRQQLIVLKRQVKHVKLKGHTSDCCWSCWPAKPGRGVRRCCWSNPKRS